MDDLGKGEGVNLEQQNGGDSFFSSFSSVAETARDVGRTIISADSNRGQRAVSAALWRTINPGYQGIASGPEQKIN